MTDSATRPRPFPNGDLAPSDARDDLQTRIAWYYYISGMTQQEIADLLGTSRNRVNRYLASSRESGVVKFAITRPMAEMVRLEAALQRKYGLQAAIVVPTPPDPDRCREAIGFGAGAWLADRIQDGMSIGIGWGRTLRTIVQAIQPRPLKRLDVVSLMGGLSHCSRINTFEIVSDFAELFGGAPYFFTAPIYASTEAARGVILEQRAIQETWRKARAVDLAMVSAGDMEHSLITEFGLGGEADLESIRAAGAVGEVMGHFVGPDGAPVAHEINRRVVALDLDDLPRIETVVLASGGPAKVPVIDALLNARRANVVATDEETARSLLGETRSAA